jgi:multisubunit Na+/H+ antiporter MnhC subunit
MTIEQQIFWGSGYMGLGMFVHILSLALGAQAVNGFSDRIRRYNTLLQVAIVLVLALTAIVVGLTIQVWMWASVWVRNDILADWNTSVYFSLVTYTSLGYGDIVLGPPVRIFAVFSAVNGVLSFGASTAFLVAILSRFIGRDRPG